MNKKELKLRRMTKKVWVLVGIGLLWIFGTIYVSVNAKTVSTRELINLAFSSIGGFGIVSATILNVWNALDTSRNNLNGLKIQRNNTKRCLKT